MTPDRDAIDAAFAEFDENLKLDPNERDAAVKRWNDVADVLTDAGLVSGTFLQGSFARKTMRKPLKDVDVVVLATPSTLDSNENDPTSVIEALRSEILKEFTGATSRVSKHALTVEFPDSDFSVDITPARDGEDRLVYIGNTETAEWDESDCRLMNDAVTERNGETKGRFIRQARMAREIAARMKEQDPRLKVLNGLVAESILYAAVSEPIEYGSAMLDFLDAGSVMANSKILTPSGREDITQKRDWTSADRELVRGAFETLCLAAREAERLAEAGDSERALDSWAEICGEQFPLPERTVEEYLGGLNGGAATRSGSVTEAVDTGVHVAPQRAWKS